MRFRIDPTTSKTDPIRCKFDPTTIKLESIGTKIDPVDIKIKLNNPYPKRSYYKRGNRKSYRVDNNIKM
ncbi:hypothetical protein [Riemerella columbina]|uniref:hypothetical protein n=1 Tax=Riemerella columbina TaxID=103810 RepID=UPI0012EACAE8|nr:hypothetical protein [Riemerella columbina]